MKTVLNRQFLLSLCTCVCILLSSWTPKKGLVSGAFARLIESQAVSDGEGIDQAVIDRFYSWVANRQVNATNFITCTWSVSGTASPYRGGHLQVILEEVTTFIDFDNENSGSYDLLYFNGSTAQIRAVCSSYYQWAAGGYLHLYISINGNVAFDDYKYNPSGPGTAPALGLFNEPQDVYVSPGDHVVIHLEAVENAP